MTSRKLDTVSFTPRHLAVYDGRRYLGEVLIGRMIRAVDAFGEEIGVFETEAEARHAVLDVDRGMRTHTGEVRS